MTPIKGGNQHMSGLRVVRIEHKYEILHKSGGEVDRSVITTRSPHARVCRLLFSDVNDGAPIERKSTECALHSYLYAYFVILFVCDWKQSTHTVWNNKQVASFLISKF